MNSDLWVLLPEVLLSVGSCALLLLPRLKSSRLLGFLTLALLLAAFDLKLFGLNRRPLPQNLFYGMFSHDTLTVFLQLLTLGSSVLVTLSVMGYAKEEFRSRRELFVLLILSTVGILLLAGAQHLALIYVGLEMVSLLSYLMTGFLKKEDLSTEAALKYFLFGSVATGMMLYGISLIYGLTGTLDLTLLANSFPQILEKAPAAAAVAITLLVAGFGFKVALVPFHMWAPDAYEGAPTPVAAFISVGPKIAGFAVLSRVFLIGLSLSVTFWGPLLGILALLTMTVGNLVALVQTNVKRLLAYSSIAQAGTIVIGLAVGTPLGFTATLYYLAAYLLMNIGAFAGVIAVSNGSRREDLGSFSGLSRREPFLAFMITICLLSLAGIPPMAGFFAKMWIFGAALQAGRWELAVGAALNSVISLFYYVKVIKIMYLDAAPQGAGALPRSRSLQLALILSILGLFLLGLAPGPWLTFASQAFPLPLKAGDLPWL